MFLKQFCEKLYKNTVKVYWTEIITIYYGNKNTYVMSEKITKNKIDYTKYIFIYYIFSFYNMSVVYIQTPRTTLPSCQRPFPSISHWIGQEYEVDILLLLYSRNVRIPGYPTAYSPQSKRLFIFHLSRHFLFTRKSVIFELR